MRKKTYLTLAITPSIARTRAIPSWVKPILEDSMRELTGVTLEALAGSKGQACNGGVAKLTWIAALSLFAAVSIGALGPVVASDSRTPFYLIGVHSELIGAKDSFVDVIVVDGVVVVFRRYEVGKLVFGESVDAGIYAFQHVCYNKGKIVTRERCQLHKLHAYMQKICRVYKEKKKIRMFLIYMIFYEF